MEFHGSFQGRPLTEEEKKARKKAERERKRQEARDAAEKKKRFALTPEKKRKLRVCFAFSPVFEKTSENSVFQLLIMKMATENIKDAADKRSTARKKYVDERVKPAPDDYNALNEAHLVSLLKELYKQLSDTEEQRYDMEMKIRKQDYDVKKMSFL